MIGPHLFQTKTTITLSNINKIELAKLRNKMWITIGLNKKNLITFLTSNYHKQLPFCCRVVSLCSVSEPRPTMQTCHPVEQQSMSGVPSCLAGQGHCFCIMTNPTPCLFAPVCEQGCHPGWVNRLYPLLNLVSQQLLCVGEHLVHLPVPVPWNAVLQQLPEWQQPRTATA